MHKCLVDLERHYVHVFLSLCGCGVWPSWLQQLVCVAYLTYKLKKCIKVLYQHNCELVIILQNIITPVNQSWSIDFNIVVVLFYLQCIEKVYGVIARVISKWWALGISLNSSSIFEIWLQYHRKYYHKYLDSHNIDWLVGVIIHML